ncbi:hypothetical protein ACFQ6Q_32365 [Streptomyces sp. NPDC056437]|uniref:hypothetical protein n=1 Tax=Streptomyces sp. NPDC056437 TaxID=3345816 RepID=UPI0036C59D7B
MWSHAVTGTRLVITLHEDPGIARRAQLAQDISALVRSHRPESLLVVLEDAAESSAALSAVLRAQRDLGMPMTVRAASVAVRRMLEMNGNDGLVVQARTGAAEDTAFTTAV